MAGECAHFVIWHVPVVGRSCVAGTDPARDRRKGRTSPHQSAAIDSATVRRRVLPSPLFAGFLPKRTLRHPAQLATHGVREICSVSTCLSPIPEGWLPPWERNAFGFCDVEADLRPEHADPRLRFDLFAYQLFPVRSLHGELSAMIVQPAPGTVPPDYEFLGYDVVTKSLSDSFECSPLSCNHAAEHFPVNAFCLIDELPDAQRALVDLAANGRYEPGPYHLVAVHRKRAF